MESNEKNKKQQAMPKSEAESFGIKRNPAIRAPRIYLSEEEIIRIYGKRWQIEVFFKTCKSMLNLIGECHSLSYDALTAHTAIVFTRYMLLALEQRQNSDQRTLGELFFYLADEMADITFSRSFYILMEALVASLQEILKLTDDQISEFVTDFESRLPEYLQKALHPTVSVA